MPNGFFGGAPLCYVKLLTSISLCDFSPVNLFIVSFFIDPPREPRRVEENFSPPHGFPQKHFILTQVM